MSFIKMTRLFLWGWVLDNKDQKERVKSYRIWNILTYPFTQKILQEDNPINVNLFQNWPLTQERLNKHFDKS